MNPADKETVQVTLNVPSRLLAHWDNGWQYETGNFTFRIGPSIAKLPLSTTVMLEALAAPLL